MKRYCKNIRLDKDWIMACMLECFSDKWKRRDVAGFLAGYQTGQPLSVRAVSRLIQEKRSNVDPLLERAAEDLAREIKERDVHFPEIHYSMRYDGNSGKLREIGVESIKQQIYNYVAVNALKELFERKIGKYQCASVPGRGQVYGKNAIERWIRKNPDKTRAGAKADVRHCYPSINTRKLMRFLRKQVKNDDLLYLVETLIASYKQGLSIGSYLSQWLCNYYLSFAYHYAQQKLFKVQKRRGQEKRTRLFYKIIFYMDDILIVPSWEEVKEEDKDKMILHIDPGTAFGTGMHETTQLVIRQLKKFVTKDTQMLDVGTGSGILGIVALKLGAAHVVGTDLDPCAIPAVADNKAANGIKDETFDMLIGNIIDDKEVQDTVGYEKYDIVTANILADVLVPLTPVIVNQMKKGAYYITSGILDVKEEVVVKAVQDAGLQLVEVTHQGEWVSVTARKE